MIITIPFKTPTINHLYTRNRFTGGRCKTNEANKLRKEILKIVDGINERLAEYDGAPLGVDVSIFENWYCKNGSIKKKDIANREKFLIDSVFEGLGIDDRMIFYHSMRKVQSETEEKAVLTIEVL